MYYTLYPNLLVAVSCSVGTYYNVVNGRCEGCPKGTYQPTEGVLTCMVCPDNTDTSTNTSKSIHQCLGQYYDMNKFINSRLNVTQGSNSEALSHIFVHCKFMLMKNNTHPDPGVYG